MAVETLPLAAGQAISFAFEQVQSPWRQGVWLATDGVLRVADSRRSQFVLWSDTAPLGVEIACEASDGLLRFYNVWDAGRGRRSLSPASGMVVEELGGGARRYACNDVGMPPDFQRLVFRISVEQSADNSRAFGWPSVARRTLRRGPLLLGCGKLRPPLEDAAIYRVRWDDSDRFQSFVIDLPGENTPLETFLQFAGVPLADSWIPLPIYSHQPRRERPSFWHLFGAAVIVMEHEVVDRVGEFLYPVGELLPLLETDTGEEFLALNILRDVNCLNPSAYQIDQLRAVPEFIPHRLPESGLFKVPQLDTTTIFYLERPDDDGSLIQTIERDELTGLRFEPVWNSTDGPRPINLILDA